MLNSWSGTGKIIDKPELRKVNTSRGETNVVNFKVAVKRNGHSSQVDDIPCSAWNQLAEDICKNVHKNDLVNINGTLETHKQYFGIQIPRNHFWIIKHAQQGSDDDSDTTPSSNASDSDIYIDSDSDNNNSSASASSSTSSSDSSSSINFSLSDKNLNSSNSSASSNSGSKSNASSSNQSEVSNSESSVSDSSSSSASTSASKANVEKSRIAKLDLPF